MDRRRSVTEVGSMPVREVFARVVLLAFLLTPTDCSRIKSRQDGATRSTSAPALAGLMQAPQRRPLQPQETTPEIEQRAKEILDAKQDAPMGTEVPFEIDGRAYVARIEEHYHEPGGPLRPWGHHRGVTVYRAE
jgi:hypothetical protein